MKYKVKRFSVLSQRTKEGLKGATKGLAAGVGLGAGLGVLGGHGLGGKQKLSLSIASMILTLPLGAWAGYKAGIGEWDQEHKTLSSFPGDNQKIRRKATEDLAEELSKTYPELSGLQKISEDKELKSLYPEWGDGDEYPCFNLILSSGEKKNNFIPILSWNFQDESVGINPVKRWWCTEDNPEKKINLKSYLLRNYTFELRDYKDAKKRDSYCMEPEDYDEVISWIECVIKKVRQYL